MSLIADGLLILAGFAAAIYCLVLSRRIRRLTNAGEGIGAEIENLNRSVSEVQEATKRANRAAEEASKKLAEEVRNANTVTAKLERLVRKVDRADEQPVVKDFLGSAEPKEHQKIKQIQKISFEQSPAAETWSQNDGIERHDHAIYSKADAIAELEESIPSRDGSKGSVENVINEQIDAVPDPGVLSVKRLPI